MQKLNGLGPVKLDVWGVLRIFIVFILSFIHGPLPEILFAEELLKPEEYIGNLLQQKIPGGVVNCSSQ
jgi:hypothetical protein